MGSVNSVFLNVEAGIVIGLDGDAIRVWDPVRGVELHVYESTDGDDAFVPGLSSIFRTV